MINLLNICKIKYLRILMDDLIEKIKKKFKNHNYREIYTNIVNNSTDKKIIKLKMIEDERDTLRYVRNLKYKRSKYSIKPKVNDLYKKL